MSDDPRPACDERIQGGDFRAPHVLELGNLTPCKYCFPDGEIDADETDLLIGTCGDTRRVVHRHERTGEVAYEYPSNGGSKLAYALQDPEVTDPSEVDWSEHRGGDA